MRLRCLLAAVGLPLASAWIFPAGLEDGFYSVSLNDSDSSGAGTLVRRYFRDWEGKHDYLVPEAPQHDWPGDDPNGEEQYAQFEAPQRLPLRERARHLDRLPVPVSNFQCMFNAPRYQPAEHLATRQSLGRYCERYLVPGRTVHIAVTRDGLVGAFVCNQSGNDQVCSGREYEWVTRHWLDLRCGPRGYGQAHAIKWRKWYGRAYPGMELCPGDNKGLHENIWRGSPSDAEMRELLDPPGDGGRR